MSTHRRLSLGLLLLLAMSHLSAQTRRKVIINEDCSGPGGSNMQTLLLLIQSPDVEVLGITVVSGDQWRDEEVAHTLRLLEIIGRTDIPVMKGAALRWCARARKRSCGSSASAKCRMRAPGTIAGGTNRLLFPHYRKASPQHKPLDEDAIHFLVRMVRQYPHEVTIYEGGPMTNLALAISLDPEFPELAQELVFMGGSLNPQTTDPEFANNPRHEFNFWFDPEAAHIVLRAPWKKIVCTPTDISIKARLIAGNGQTD